MTNLVYIAGSGRCGSTLLDLLLGNHSKMSGLGEVHRLSINPRERKCSCQETIMECPYWRPRIQRLCDEKGIALRKWDDVLPMTQVNEKSVKDRESVRWIEAVAGLGSQTLLRALGMLSSNADSLVDIQRNSWDLYDIITRMDDSEFVVDSTKNALRMKLLYMRRPEQTYILHLVRDGRAVIASSLRRRDISVEMAARRWRVANRNIEMALKTVPQRNVVQVRYEDLCDNVSTEMERVAQWLGVPFEEAMSRLERREYHEIPGNPMLFRRAETDIVKDERWKDELDQNTLKTFDRLCGSMNRRYGYV